MTAIRWQKHSFVDYCLEIQLSSRVLRAYVYQMPEMPGHSPLMDARRRLVRRARRGRVRHGVAVLYMFRLSSNSGLKDDKHRSWYTCHATFPKYYITIDCCCGEQSIIHTSNKNTLLKSNIYHGHRMRRRNICKWVNWQSWHNSCDWYVDLYKWFHIKNMQGKEFRSTTENIT